MSHKINIALKFTTALNNTAKNDFKFETALSFYIGIKGAKIGRNNDTNEIEVPSDIHLAASSHSIIDYSNGLFYISDCECNSFSASKRINGRDIDNKKWIIDKGAQFSFEKSVFKSNGINDNNELVIRIIEGPLKNEIKIINQLVEASIGRSSESTICVPDKELSRKHSKIGYDKKLNKYFVTDNDSTNGTYMQVRIISYVCRLRYPYSQ